MVWWWWTTVLVLSSMLSVSLGFLAGCMWQSSVGHWPDESEDQRRQLDPRGDATGGRVAG